MSNVIYYAAVPISRITVFLALSVRLLFVCTTLASNSNPKSIHNPAGKKQ